MDKMYIAREKLAERIADDFKDKITGASDDVTVIDDNPEKVFFVGKLHAQQDIANDITQSQVSIGSVGADFRVSKEQFPDAKITIHPRGNFYYRCYPTLQQQREAMLNRANEYLNVNFETFEDLENNYRSNPEKYKAVLVKLVPVYKSLSIQNPDLYIQFVPRKLLNEDGVYGFLNEQSPLNKEFQDKLDSLEEQLYKSDETGKSIYKNEVTEETSIGDLSTKESYEAFLERNKKGKRDVRQNWRLYFDVSTKLIDDEYMISIALINDSHVQSNSKTHKSDSQAKDKKTIETLFNAGIDIQLEGADFVPITSDYFEDDYKYDYKQKAVGLNCSIEYDQESNTIKTEQMPTYVQKRLVTKDIDNIDISFKGLMNDPQNDYKQLRSIKTAMEEELTSWEEEYDEKKSSLSEEAKNKMEEDIQSFQYEINRFDFGISILNDSYAKESFILMNKTFSESSSKFKSWRLFQIVFIVSVIPDIVACDDKILATREKQDTKLDYASLLYFPTGSGKTEAFLGVLVFNLFFDRLRGKNFGVTSMLRYPLRLLSVQQVQRVADILAQAELIRRDDPRISESEQFALGYFVGSKNTPNNISPEEAQEYINMTESERDEKKILDYCPFCKQKTVHLKFDKETYRLEHICTNPECQSGGVLPIFMVDSEIYRYLPSVIISTVDKLALVGCNRNIRNIFDGASYKCPKHGYTSTGKCLVPECNEHLEIVDEEAEWSCDPAPTLFVQDELHLIRESLGTYASHYESFIDYYIKNLSSSGRNAKIIGATATITNYEEQINQLYSRDVIRFPSESIHLNEDFYSKIDEDDTQRRIIGYAPFGKSTISAVGSSLKYMREVVYDYLKHPQKVLQIPGMPISTDIGAKEILEDYWVFIEYNNIKRDGNNVEGQLETPINIDLKAEGVPEFITRKMTGDETFQEVKKILGEIDNSGNSFDEVHDVNLINATSMISHGIDTDRFNMMFFYGIPGNTAEYVQAYSRTGRKYPSVVVDIMRPTRETDMSYLNNFVQFHEYKDKLIEPVPVNRWATKAIRETIPGIFSGLLLMYYDKKEEFRDKPLNYMKNIKEAINHGNIHKEEIRSQLLQIYQCETNDYQYHIGTQYADYITTFVDNIFSKIKATEWEDNINISQGFSKMGYPIMTNLRDTDTQVSIELD